MSNNTVNICYVKSNDKYCSYNTVSAGKESLFER